MWLCMQPRLTQLLILVIATALVSSSADAIQKPHQTYRGSSNPAEAAFWGNLVPMDRNGSQIKMRRYRSPSQKPTPTAPRQHAQHPVHIPRGSSTYIPPINPSPSAGPTPQQILNQQTVQPYKPPPVNTFGDRVRDAIHSYPLDKGIGNNPTDQQMYIRQRVN